MRKSTEDMIKRFNESAQNWGWSQDCASGKGAQNSEDSYIEDKKILTNRIEELEKDRRHFKKRKKNRIWSDKVCKYCANYDSGGCGVANCLDNNHFGFDGIEVMHV